MSTQHRLERTRTRCASNRPVNAHSVAHVLGICLFSAGPQAGQHTGRTRHKDVSAGKQACSASFSHSQNQQRGEKAQQNCFDLRSTGKEYGVVPVRDGQ